MSSKLSGLCGIDGAAGTIAGECVATAVCLGGSGAFDAATSIANRQRIAIHQRSQLAANFQEEVGTFLTPLNIDRSYECPR